ncbi:MAG: dockerin type I domain-containing protein [Phycisphaerae bacterium]
MTEKKGHFDEDLDLRISPKFSEDLNTLFKPQFSVPSEVDRAIMDQVNRRLVQRHWRHRVFRHVSIWRIAAAAAVIIFAFSLNLTQKSGPITSRSVLVEAQAVDIDRNGRVDILDAFKLARHIESAESTDKSLSLVSSTGQALQKQGWDINGDGLVDRNDVDLVALSAVRLDKNKGVL